MSLHSDVPANQRLIFFSGVRVGGVQGGVEGGKQGRVGRKTEVGGGDG